MSFAGCGFLAFYHLGVATCLSSHAPQFLKNVTAFAGASAGSLVATMLATSAPLNKCTDFVIDLTDEARGHPLGPFNPQFDLVGSLRKCLQLYLPSNSHKIASGRLYISVTSLKDRKNAIISEFESTEELIQVRLLAILEHLTVKRDIQTLSRDSHLGETRHSSLETRLSSREKQDETGNLLLRGTVQYVYM